MAVKLPTYKQEIKYTPCEECPSFVDGVCTGVHDIHAVVRDDYSGKILGCE